MIEKNKMLATSREVRRGNAALWFRRVLGSPYLSLISRLVLGGVFLYAGASKESIKSWNCRTFDEATLSSAAGPKHFNTRQAA